jgi:hypothetical protein
MRVCGWGGGWGEGVCMCVRERESGGGVTLLERYIFDVPVRLS